MNFVMTFISVKQIEKKTPVMWEEVIKDYAETRKKGSIGVCQNTVF